jgi:hypothetical protein
MPCPWARFEGMVPLVSDNAMRALQWHKSDQADFVPPDH